MIELVPIKPEAFGRWKAECMAEYAKEKEKSGLSLEDARMVAEKSFQDLLPDNERSKDQFIYSVVDKQTGAVVGTIWWGLMRQGKDPLPWIYDISMQEEFRGRGYGRAAMLAVEKEVKANGFHRLGLHVFGHNAVARKLYDSLEYQVTSLVMQKDL